MFNQDFRGMKQEQAQSSRIIAVDFARVLAILFMIQGHTLDVLLLPAARQGFFFDKWLFLRGLTAPMFLTLSGASFAIATMRRWDSHVALTPAFWKRARRFLFFVALGYAMHLPMKSFRNISFVSSAGWRDWLQVDVLQCIGISLVFLQLLVLIAKTPARFAKLAVGSGAAAILLTPLMWKMGTDVPLFFSSYLNGNTGSLFPLFPWAGYVLCGVGLGYLYARKQQDLASSIWPVALIGIAAMGAGFCLNQAPFTLYANADYWKTSPNLFLMRMGYVCIILAGLTYLTQRISLPRRAVQSVAQESLTIYIIHICILYGSTWNLGMRQLIGPTLTFVPTLEWILLLLVSMTLAAWAWNWFKHNEPVKLRWLQSAAVLLIAYSRT
jgi:uncharacterized membrane protein